MYFLNTNSFVLHFVTRMFAITHVVRDMFQKCQNVYSGVIYVAKIKLCTIQSLLSQMNSMDGLIDRVYWIPARQHDAAN